MLSALFNALQSEHLLFAWAVVFMITMTFVLYFSLSRHEIKLLTDALDLQIVMNNTYLDSLQQLADERMAGLNLEQVKEARPNALPPTHLRMNRRNIDKTVVF